MKTIFEYKDYVLFLKDFLRENKGQRGFQSKMAQALGVHSSYITRTIDGSVQFTPDHAASLAQFIKMSENETQCLLLLVQLQRAGTPALKKILHLQLNELYEKKSNANITESPSKNIQTRNIDKLNPKHYYAFWQHMAIHMLLMLPGKHKITTIARRLNLDEATVEKALNVLSELGVIEKKNGQWVVKIKHIHWDSTDDEFIRNSIRQTHAYWRQQFSIRCQNGSPDSFRSTIMLSIGEEDFKMIKDELSRTAAKIRELSVNASDDDVFVIGLDAIRL